MYPAADTPTKAKTSRGDPVRGKGGLGISVRVEEVCGAKSPAGAAETVSPTRRNIAQTNIIATSIMARCVINFLIAIQQKSNRLAETGNDVSTLIIA